ncbi:MAG: hypothetical protein PHD76_12905 [Methylacidiphilales bacterium]|nr:hypothetical protein [Candidatus Methylacidiphilales bacterium]
MKYLCCLAIWALCVIHAGAQQTTPAAADANKPSSTDTQAAAKAATGTPSKDTPAQEAVEVPRLKGDAVANFMEYRWKIKERIYNNWQSYLEQYRQSSLSGKVKYRFYVNASGAVTVMNQKPVDEKNLLAVLAYRSIAEVNKDKLSYPVSIKSEYPTGFFDEVTFRAH